MLVWTPELWHLSHELTYLVYGWAVVVSVLSAIIGKPLVRLSYTYNEREADFRFTLQEARREAEAIAYAQAEEMTRQQASSRLGLVVDMQIAVMKRNIFVQAFTTYANGVVPWMAPVLLAPLFVLHGSGVIFEAQLGVTMLFGALAVVVNQFGSITSGLAVADRLDSLRQAQEDYAKQPIPEGGIAITDGADLVFQKLILKSFDGKTDLIKIGPEGVEGLDMVIKKGESLCVLGDDAMAKTEFVRLLNRLTKSGQGLVTLPSREDMSFLLETPFLPPVSLREAVTGDPKKVDDEEVLKVLRLVGLATLRKRVGGLDTPVNWGKELKSNELQRLSFARAVFSKHSYVVIDGGMSALNTKTTQLFYGMLSSRPDTTVVSVAASSTAAKYHKWVLVLNVEKPWELHTFTDFERIEQERKVADAQKNAGKTPSKWVINLPVLGRWEFQNVSDVEPSEVVPPEAANNNGGGK
jgi:putative ATP-binding cassette transporter